MTKLFSEKSVQNVYAKNAPLLLFESALFIFAAILIFVRPLQVLATLTLLLGIGLGLFGLFQIFVGFFGKDNDLSGRTLNFIFGVINIVLGLVFFLQPIESIIMVVYVFAILFRIKAVRTFVIAWGMARARTGRYALDIFISFLMAALAVAVLFFPQFGAMTAMYFIAFTLILYAIADVHIYMELGKLRKRSFR